VDLGRSEWIDGAQPSEFAQFLGVAEAVGMESGTTPDSATKAIEGLSLAAWWPLMHALVRGLDAESLLAALERVDNHTLKRLRDELQTILTGGAGLLCRATVLVQPNWFIWYFAIRYSSRTWSPVLRQMLAEMHQAGQLPTPLPSPGYSSSGDCVQKLRNPNPPHVPPGASHEYS
jgi:hypothetical protein